MIHSNMIVLKNVSFTTDAWMEEQGVTLLKDLSVAVRRGEWISVIGANGSGKSTLLKLMAGIIEQGVAGKVERTGIGGKDSCVPIVMQQPDAALIGSTPWEDVVMLLERYGMRADRIVDCSEEALRTVGLGDRMHQSLDTLSGGQKQLVAIAGSLAAEAPMLLLDEVTAMLDPEMSEYVLKQVQKLHEAGSTVIWITQKLEEQRLQDRTLVLSEGKLVHDGHAGELFRRSAPTSTDSAGEQWGLKPTYAVKVAWELELQGIRLSSIPLTAQQLIEVVNIYGT